MNTPESFRDIFTDTQVKSMQTGLYDFGSRNLSQIGVQAYLNRGLCWWEDLRRSRTLPEKMGIFFPVEPRLVKGNDNPLMYDVINLGGGFGKKRDLRVDLYNLGIPVGVYRLTGMAGEIKGEDYNDYRKAVGELKTAVTKLDVPHTPIEVRLDFGNGFDYYQYKRNWEIDAWKIVRYAGYRRPVLQTDILGHYHVNSKTVSGMNIKGIGRVDTKTEINSFVDDKVLPWVWKKSVEKLKNIWGLEKKCFDMFKKVTNLSEGEAKFWRIAYDTFGLQAAWYLLTINGQLAEEYVRRMDSCRK